MGFWWCRVYFFTFTPVTCLMTCRESFRQLRLATSNTEAVEQGAPAVLGSRVWFSLRGSLTNSKRSENSGEHLLYIFTAKSFVGCPLGKEKSMNLSA